MIEKNDLLKDILSLNESLEKVTHQFDFGDINEEKKLEEICKEKGIDVDFFIEILNIFNNTDYFPKLQLGSFPIPIIIDYLKKTHKYYLNKRLLEIEQSITLSYSNEILKNFLQNSFLIMKQDLVEHIRYEEGTLFPYINQLYKSFTTGKPLSLPEKLKGYSINTFEKLHTDDVENNILEVKKYIIQSSPNVVDLSPYRVLLNQLDSFEQELRVHALVEDEILIPKAKILEKTIA